MNCKKERSPFLFLMRKKGLLTQSCKICILFCYERQERNHSRALNRRCELALMLSAVTADTSGNNLAALRNESSKLRRVFVINMLNLIHTEYTDLFLGSSCSLGSFNSFSHEFFLLINFYQFRQNGRSSSLPSRSENPIASKSPSKPEPPPICGATEGSGLF